MTVGLISIGRSSKRIQRPIDTLRRVSVVSERYGGRTMTLGVVNEIDFDTFHSETVQGFLRNGRGAAAARSMPVGRSISFVVDDSAWTYRSSGNDFEVVEGRSPGLTAVLSRESFSDLVNETWSVFGLLYGGRVVLENGTFEHLVAWEPVLQSLWFDRPIYELTCLLYTSPSPRD